MNEEMQLGLVEQLARSVGELQVSNNFLRKLIAQMVAQNYNGEVFVIGTLAQQEAAQNPDPVIVTEHSPIDHCIRVTVRRKPQKTA